MWLEVSVLLFSGITERFFDVFAKYVNVKSYMLVMFFWLILKWE